MAVYYKWIKGCNFDPKTASEESTLSNSAVWTYVNWSNNFNKDEEHLLLPTIEVRLGKDKGENNNVSCGHMLTSAIGATVTKPWEFTESLKVSEVQFENTKFKATDNGVELSKEEGSDDSLTVNMYTKLENVSSKQMEVSYLNVTGEVVGGYTALINGDTKITKTLLVEDKCEANYFNAKSDKRAKENIKPLNFSALDLVKNLPVYTFNYKNDTQTVPGILAQDLLERQPDTISLVDNKEASGENGDYMSIKSDKLIYILLAAIQEQQAEIDALKKQLQTK